MSPGDQRLGRLSAGLSARERVLLLAHAMYNDERPDPSILGTIPQAQGAQFNHFTALANGVLHTLTAHALYLNHAAEALALRFMVLSLWNLWAQDRNSLLWDASLLARIPIAEEEYAAKVRAARAEEFPLRDAVEITVVTRGADESPAVYRAIEQEIRTAVAAGALAARKHGRSLVIENGALNDWLGEELEAFPDWGWRYLPLSPKALEEHGLPVAAVAWIASQAAQGPLSPKRVLPALADDARSLAPDAELRDIDRIAKFLADTVRAQLAALGGQLAALDMVVGEICAEFDDESIIAPTARNLIEGARSQLSELHRIAPSLVGECETPEVDADFLAQLRRGFRVEESRY